MRIERLQIEGFRGIERAVVNFDTKETMLIGPNGAGKSTILEALALLFGRDRLVRSLTEHDFFGSNPVAADRIRLIATITGFTSNAAADHGQWFSERRGVPKWRAGDGKLKPEAKGETDALCVQVAFCARFDRKDVSVETVRYFHDDDSVVDPFDDEAVQPISTKLLSELGFFLVPAHRTWDQLVSFNSELFRRILESTGPIEAKEILSERDRLRKDDHRVDLAGALNELREGMNLQLSRLIPGGAALELRLTGTDTDSLLKALVPHYRYSDSVSLPAGRHGSGLLSLQTALLVLQIATRRKEAAQNVIVVVEEPELHMAPGTQAQILHELANNCDQLICTTHSPRVASVWPVKHTRFVNLGVGGKKTVSCLLEGSVPPTAKNGIRKLFQECRQDYIEALMHRVVLVPEGRMDVEWLRAFSRCAAARFDDSDKASSTAPFGTVFGIAPTHDACIQETVEHIQRARPDVCVLVDGDKAGDDYIKSLLSSKSVPEYILQWPKDWVIEDVVGWALAKGDATSAAVQAEYPEAPGTLPEIVTWLKTERGANGAKTDLVVHEAIISALLGCAASRSAIRSLLDSFVQIVSTKAPGMAEIDAVRSRPECSVWRLSLES
jgi:putative ATP-dependent endonuclease of the OLD family